MKLFQILSSPIPLFAFIVVVAVILMGVRRRSRLPEIERFGFQGVPAAGLDLVLKIKIIKPGRLPAFENLGSRIKIREVAFLKKPQLPRIADTVNEDRAGKAQNKCK